LVVLTVSVYYPAIFHPFVDYDDGAYVTKNPYVQKGLSFETVSWAVTSTQAANWHPVTWISHALDCEFYGLDPHGHHLTSVILHAANVVLLFLCLYWATRAASLSAMVAALFALHPFNVESVAWVAERKNVLSTFFFLLTLLSYGRYVRRPGLARYLTLCLAFLLGLAAKPMLVTLPFVLLLLDYWPLARIRGWTEPSKAFQTSQSSFSSLLREKIPLLALAAGSCVITVVAQRGGNAAVNLGDIPLLLRIGNAVYSYAKYIEKVFWPVNMAVFYPHPLDKLTFFQIGLSAIFLLAISCIVWSLRTRCPYAITGWCWFLGTLVPVIGIIQVGAQGMADRYMYIPEIGLFVALVWTAHDWAQSQTSVSISTGLKVTAVLVLTAFGILTIRQINYWDSSYDLWTHTLAITADNFVANDELGGLLLREGKPEALPYYEAAARQAPFDPESHAIVAAALQDRGDFEGAIRAYHIALRAKDPNFLANAYANLAVIHFSLGENSEARVEAEKAMAYDPEAIRGMIRQLAALLREHPVAPGYLRLGLLSEVAGQNQDANLAFQRALQLDPNFAPARQALQQIPAQ
jgi:protein O-mannosyl-transferase